MAAGLQRAGYQPSVVARGAHLDALKRKGLEITEHGKTQVLEVSAFGEQDDLPPQNLILVTLKAHSISAALPHLKTLLHEDTIVLFAVNGVPWWFFYGLQGNYGNGKRLVQSVDPSGCIWSEIEPERAIGCVLYPAAELVAPGVVKHVSGNRISIGEPIGQISQRANDIATILADAGCRASVRRDIRNEIWIKLWGNVAFNPLSVITGATLDRLATDSGTQAIVTKLMQEIQAIGLHYGARFGMTISKRIQGAAAIGAHKTSMLQDYLNGKPLETGAMIDAVLELGDLAQVETPTIRMMQALLQMKLVSEGLNMTEKEK